MADAKGRFLANAARASRKDARDAVVAARGAFAGWAGATAYNRGQVLYRVAEIMEGRREQFVAEVGAAEGLTARGAGGIVDAAIDRWVWYAGWSDKFAQVDGASNPVAGPYFNFSVPEPTGVVAVVAPQALGLLGLVSVVAPVDRERQHCVVVASEDRPLPAVTLGEVLATSDVPGGVVNVLTGHVAELAPWLAATSTSTPSTSPACGDRDLAPRPRGRGGGERQASVVGTGCASRTGPSEPDPRRILAFSETKTVWHPMGV